MKRRRHAVEEQIALVRQNCRDASADRVALHQGGMPHPYAGNIGDRIVSTSWKDARLHPEISGTSALALGSRRESSHDDQRQRNEVLHVVSDRESILVMLVVLRRVL